MLVELRAPFLAAWGVMNAGDRIDVPDAEAVQMIERGAAVPVRAATPEQAVKRPRAEKAKK